MKKYLILLFLILCFFTGCDNNKDETEINLNTHEQSEETKEEFSQEKQKIINTVYKYLIDNKYIDESKLEEFNITKILKQGYYESNKDVFNIQFNCNYKCKDNNDSCILKNGTQSSWLTRLSENEDEEDYAFVFEYDLKEHKVIGKWRAIPMNSDYIQVVEEIK